MCLQHDTELVSVHFGDDSNIFNGLIIVTSSFPFASDMKLGSANRSIFTKQIFTTEIYCNGMRLTASARIRKSAKELSTIGNLPMS